MNKKSLLTGLGIGAVLGAGSFLLHDKFCKKKCEYFPFFGEATEKDIDSSKITVQLTKNPKKKKEDPNEYGFGKYMSDHMLEIDYIDKKFTVPRIVPFHDFPVHPATSVIHYGITAFEGMKAYKDSEGKIRLFRPMKNMKRFLKSARRLCLPDFNPEELLKCIEKLVMIEKDWVPEKKGFAAYIRPIIMGTDQFLGLKPASKYKIFVIISPVGSYYSDGMKGIRLYAQNEYLRSWVGGTGGNKLGGNYAPTLLPTLKGFEKECKSVLFLDKEGKVTEAGAMNCMVIWENENNERELITPSLEDNTILPGITRDSILKLAKESGQFDKVTEGDITINQLVKAHNENRLFEIFGCGTAAIVSPVLGFKYEGKTYDFAKDGKLGEFTLYLYDTILSIQHGEIEHQWSHLIEEQD
ncbi:branched-chain-amino-acid aminotransferase [Anaeramoeba flamelloides]|uniref:Branched-chain-amino-acid aminotransferase n=1 Tax=Anaeramoeba flamelloides TaxID=1746091 RepID=A0AAV7YX43_9EUKA|nr:branched-chain-amino-acid aminotransferase [Anaeramoeba flamelloides]